MYTQGQTVIVTDQMPHAIGVIDQVSDWNTVIGSPATGPCYFVRVKEWDKGANGGRWIDEAFLNAVNATAGE